MFKADGKCFVAYSKDSVSARKKVGKRRDKFDIFIIVFWQEVYIKSGRGLKLYRRAWTRGYCGEIQEDAYKITLQDSCTKRDILKF